MQREIIVDGVPKYQATPKPQTNPDPKQLLQITEFPPHLAEPIQSWHEATTQHLNFCNQT